MLVEALELMEYPLHSPEYVDKVDSGLNGLKLIAKQEKEEITNAQVQEIGLIARQITH